MFPTIYESQYSCYLWNPWGLDFVISLFIFPLQFFEHLTQCSIYTPIYSTISAVILQASPHFLVFSDWGEASIADYYWFTGMELVKMTIKKALYYKAFRDIIEKTFLRRFFRSGGRFTPRKWHFLGYFFKGSESWKCWFIRVLRIREGRNSSKTGN